MDYIAFLFPNHLCGVTEEVRTVDGVPQKCLVIPTVLNQMRKGDRGKWVMRLVLREVPPNEKDQTHEIALLYNSREDAELAKKSGWSRNFNRMGRVYKSFGKPELAKDFANTASDVVFKGRIILSDIPKYLIRREEMSGKRYVTDLKIYLGEGGMATGSICVDDIPHGNIYTDTVTGKRIIDCLFKKMKLMDSHNNTHHLVVQMPGGGELEIGLFREWKKPGSPQRHEEKTAESDEHNTGVNQRTVPDSIGGVKF